MVTMSGRALAPFSVAWSLRAIASSSRDAATGFLAHTRVSAPRDMRTSSLSRRHIAVDG